MGLYDGVASTPSIPDIEFALYDGVLVDVTAIFMDGGQYGIGFVTKDESGKDVNRFRWTFRLKDEDGEDIYDEGEPVEVDCVTGLQFFAKAKNASKQVRIMKALMTKAEFDAWSEGESAPTLKELVGRPAQVDVTENGKGYPTIGNVLAPRQRRARRATSTADAE